VISRAAANLTFEQFHEDGLEIVTECANVLEHDSAGLLKRCHDQIDRQVAAHDHEGVLVRVRTSVVNSACDTPGSGKCLRGDEHGNIRPGCEMNLTLERFVRDVPLNGGAKWRCGTSEA
jgi:hypothetical protein